MSSFTKFIHPLKFTSTSLCRNGAVITTGVEIGDIESEIILTALNSKGGVSVGHIAFPKNKEMLEAISDHFAYLARHMK